MRTERALDDPVREMEGMLVDEYGRFEFVRTECFDLFIFAHFWAVFTYCLFDFGSLDDCGILEIASLSLDEPELKGIFFNDDC